MRASLMVLALAAALVCACDNDSPMVADTTADLSVETPVFARGAGPRVYVDAGHGNYHTIDERYAPFAELLRNDGMRVDGGRASFSAETLPNVDILVIANADYGTDGVTFTQAEIEAVQQFVRGGGSLLLIADHVPYAGAAADLARAFGIEFADVFAGDDGDGVFSIENGGLVADPAIGGVTQVRTFTGSAFRAEGARALLSLGPGWTMQRMQATGLSAKTSAEGMLQGALLEAGEGRIAVFGEAAMFTAQVSTSGLIRNRTGFGARGAEQNKAFVLNVVRWLAHAEA